MKRLLENKISLVLLNFFLLMSAFNPCHAQVKDNKLRGQP